MTTEEIIKFLPIEEGDKNELLKMYEYGDADQKYRINELVWTGYFELYNDTLKDNINREMELVKEGKAEADKDLYKRALQKTEQEMKGEMAEGITETDLSAARQAMEQIMSEIRASKAAKNAIRTTN